MIVATPYIVQPYIVCVQNPSRYFTVPAMTTSKKCCIPQRRLLLQLVLPASPLVSLPRHSSCSCREHEQTKPETWTPIDFADVAQLQLLLQQLQLQLQLCLHFLNTSTAERVDVWDRMGSDGGVVRLHVGCN